jgi:uncharacterized membrane protein YkvA (DUF1232 family)/transcriptional regulator with XRE-family HTH domain
MAEVRINDSIGVMLKELLEQQSLSMRQFSKHTGIDTATISRIINGKRKANLQHLQKFADCLGVAITDFFIEEGDVPEKKEDQQYSDDIYSSVDSIQTILESTKIYDKKFTIEMVEQQLASYQQFAQTEKGSETIANRFEEKLQAVGGIGPSIEHLKDMYLKFSMKKGSGYELALMGAALMYFISPIDVIPDYIFPIGYLDDAIAVKIVLELLSKVIVKGPKANKLL